MSERPAIMTRNLTRRFNEILAVAGLTLEIYYGEVFGLLGHNGAGKTTTVRLLNGVLAPSGGSARVLGLCPVNDGPSLRRRTGVLTETPSIDERLTGRENLQIYAELSAVPGREVSQRVRELLETFGLTDRAAEKVGGYSKGMKQRLALARALLHKPQILFLDEPTSGLDPVATRRVHDMISHMSRAEGRTVLICTHNLAEAQKLCQRVAVLEHGRLVALGTPEELAQRLGRSQRLDIELDPKEVSVATDTLQGVSGITGLSHQDGVITLQGANRETIPDLVSALVGAGVRIYRVTAREPSLEDVYFALHDAEEAR
jgi:ABC-2 type transport system ATP-binding protein